MLNLGTTGNWLCHYTRADIAFGAIVPTGQLRMSPYARMRDPLENKDLNLSPANHEGQDRRFWEDFGLACHAIKVVRDGMRVLSFTQDTPGWDPPFGCAWARARMWEHYADNHHGACLVFRRQAFIDRFRDTFQERGGPSFHLWGSVDYTPEGFAGSDARFLDPADFVGPTRYSSAAVSYLEHHPRAFLFLKQADWATEAEYRFAVFAPDAPEIYFNYGDTLAAVLVGERFPEWQFPGAKAECKARDVQLRRLGWRMGRPYPEVTVSASGTLRHRRVP